MLKNCYSSQVTPHRMEILKKLDLFYPGICLMKLPQDKFPSSKLLLLVTYVQYCLPRFLYQEQISELQTQLMEHYLNSDVFSVDEDDQSPPIEIQQNECEEEENSKSENHTEESITSHSQGENQLQPEEPFNRRRNIVEIRNLIEKIKIDSNYPVSEGLKESVDKVNQWKRQIKTFEEIKIKKKQFKKEIKESNPTFTITIGNRISIEAKEMREQIKKAAESSFAVTSQKSENQMNQLQKQKIHIILTLNKLADDNLEELFLQLMPLLQKQSLALFFIQQIITKCKFQHPTIPTNMKLCEKIQKIKSSQFQWKQQKKKKQNPFSLLLIDQVQAKFQEYLQSTEKMLLDRKGFFGFCKMLSHLIKKGMFSSKIYHNISYTLNDVLLSQIKNKNESLIQVLVEVQIIMIETLGEFFEWFTEEKIDFNEVKPEQIVCGNLIQFLQWTENNFITKSQRIKCLLINMIERKTQQKQQNQENKSILLEQEIKDILILSSEKRDQKVKKFQEQLQMNGFQLVISQIIMHISDAPKETIEYNLQFLQEELKITGKERKQFLKVYERLYQWVVMEQCQFPYLLSTLAILIHIFQIDRKKAIIIKEQTDEEFDEYECVGQKLTKRLQHYAEASLQQLIR